MSVKIALKSKKISYCFFLLFTLILIPQFACSFFESKEDYKKEIELKGITYSRESFLNEVKGYNKEIIELLLLIFIIEFHLLLKLLYLLVILRMAIYSESMLNTMRLDI